VEGGGRHCSQHRPNYSGCLGATDTRTCHHQAPASRACVPAALGARCHLRQWPHPTLPCRQLPRHPPCSPPTRRRAGTAQRCAAASQGHPRHGTTQNLTGCCLCRSPGPACRAKSRRRRQWRDGRQAAVAGSWGSTGSRTRPPRNAHFSNVTDRPLLQRPARAAGATSCERWFAVRTWAGRASASRAFCTN